jgi:hypothetical protein
LGGSGNSADKSFFQQQAVAVITAIASVIFIFVVLVIRKVSRKKMVSRDNLVITVASVAYERETFDGVNPFGCRHKNSICLARVEGLLGL